MAEQKLQLKVTADVSQAKRALDSITRSIVALGSVSAKLEHAIMKATDALINQEAERHVRSLTKAIEQARRAYLGLSEAQKRFSRPLAIGTSAQPILGLPEKSTATLAKEAAEQAAEIARTAKAVYATELQRGSTGASVLTPYNWGDYNAHVKAYRWNKINEADTDHRHSLAAQAHEASQMRAYAEAIKEAEKAERQLRFGLSQEAPVASKASNSIKDLGSSFKQSFFHAKGFSGSFGHLLNQFKRIAVYRMFKSILKGITDSFRIGTQNLVQYSAALGGVDAAAANPTMSEYATQLLYVRNSVSAAAMPALQALIPTIQTVANWFVTAANAVNQFISAIQGKSTFTRAKEYAVDYAESLGGVGSAAGKAAKELQQLMDFDEINNIITPKSGSGGGGGGTAAQDFSEMFEEAEIDSKFKTLADTAKKIYDTFSDLLPVIEAIGLGILAWKLASGFATALAELWNLSGLPAFTTGLVLTITGATIAYEAGKLWADENTRLVSYITGALGTLAAGIGGKLLLGSFVGSGWGFAIGITVGLVMYLKGVAEGNAKKALEDSGVAQLVEDVNNAVAEIKKNLKDAFDPLYDKIKGIEDITSNTNYAQKLVDRLYEIQNKSNKTAEDLEEMERLIGVLDGMGLGELRDSYNKLTGEIGLSKAEVYNLIEAMRKQALAKAYLDIITEAYKAQLTAEEELTVATDLQKEAQDKYNEVLVTYNQQVATMSPVAKEFFDTFRGGRKPVDEAKAALDKANQSVEECKNKSKEATDKVTLYTDALERLKGDYRVNIEATTSGFDKVLGKLQTVIDKTSQLKNNSNIAFNVSTRSTSMFASGGFPTQGSLFLAGETVGQTEWLGDVNGKTGVVSGNEITGIADAIYSSSAAERAELQRQNSLLTRLLEKELTISPSAGLGRVNAQSAAMYAKVTG